MKICLCDDDNKVLKYYVNKIEGIALKNDYIFEIKTFESGESLIFNLEENHNEFDIVIIDIIMKRINGIEAARILRYYGYKGIIIFLTTSKEFALDSYRVEALNYIIKNEDDDRFEKIFIKAVEQVCKELNTNIIIKLKNKRKIINLDSIIYMESLNKKVILHDKYGEREEVGITFKEMYEKVKDKGFIRCHKSYIVNIKYVKSFNKLECKMHKDIIIPIGRKYSEDFKEAFIGNEFNNILI